MPEEVFSKKIVILANSRKLSGRCIAGVEVEEVSKGLWVPTPGKEWVRPVNAETETGEVNRRDRCYEDRKEPELLDVVEVCLLDHAPKDHQKENWHIDREYYWAKIGDFAKDNLRGLTEVSHLWFTRTPSSYHGENDRIALDDIPSVRDSLRLIYVRDLRYLVHTPGEYFGSDKRKVRAIFTYRRKRYNLNVTDPLVEQEYLVQDDATYRVGSAYITVSLSEPYNGHVYKLAAAVITV